MKNEAQNFLNELEKKLWTAADFTVAIFNTNDLSIYEQHLPKHDAVTLWKANVI